MNPVLETACRWFGPSSCETGSAPQYVFMALATAMSAIVFVWFAGKVIRR